MAEFDLSSCKMKLFVFGCVLLGYYVHVLVARQKGCSFPVHGQSEKNSPILLRNGTTLIVPNNGRIDLNIRETITLACPDPKNYLVGTQSNVTHAYCVQGRFLRVANQDVTFGDLQCSRIVKGSVTNTSRRCADDKGRIYKIGYRMSSKTFVTVIEVCYNLQIGNTFYTTHTLHGEEIRHASKSNYRPAFSPEGSSVPVSVAYKQAFQRSTLNKLLKSAALSREYISENSFLARGHLSPDADFLYAATQFTSYYYINVCPQWQSINSGNWKKVEGLIRRFADKIQETLTVVTGTHQVLTLKDVNGKSMEIFLVSGNKLPVPKFLWKIVYSEKRKEAIVFVSINNPFLRHSSSKEYMLCDDICNETGWGSSSWLTRERGLIYCCDYETFSLSVTTVPKLQVKGILHGNK